MLIPVSSKHAIGSPVIAFRIISTIPAKRCPQAALMFAKVPSLIGIENRSSNNSAVRRYGSSPYVRRYTAIACSRRPYWTGCSTPTGNSATVICPQFGQRLRSLRCSVTSTASGGTSNT